MKKNIAILSFFERALSLAGIFYLANGVLYYFYKENSLVSFHDIVLAVVFGCVVSFFISIRNKRCEHKTHI